MIKFLLSICLTFLVVFPSSVRAERHFVVPRLGELREMSEMEIAFGIHATQSDRDRQKAAFRTALLDEAGRRGLFSSAEAIVRMERGIVRIQDNLFDLIVSKGLPSFGNVVLTRRGEMVILYYFRDRILVEQLQVVFLMDGKIVGFADARPGRRWVTRGLTTSFWQPSGSAGWMRTAPTELDRCISREEQLMCIGGLNAFMP